jgi:hypothetical protein
LPFQRPRSDCLTRWMHFPSGRAIPTLGF